LLNSNFKDVTTPNVDTLYASAWLDLSKGPIKLSVPATNGRYYIIELLDAWTNIFASIGSRTVGNNAQQFTIVGPNYKETGQNTNEIKSPTNLAWIIARTYTDGTPDDLKAARDQQGQYQLTPLYTTLPNAGVHLDQLPNSINSVKNQVNLMQAPEFYSNFTLAMYGNNKDLADPLINSKLNALHLYPGYLDWNSLDSNIKSALIQSVNTGQQAILNQINNPSAYVSANGWTRIAKAGNYGTDYLQRAIVAVVGLGMNLPADAVYFRTNKDSQGNTLNGSQNYTIHLDKEPPVNGFWSVTLYDSNYFLISTSTNKYSVGTKDHLTFPTDIIISSTQPQIEQSNAQWLPSPSNGPFNLVFRLYWPSGEVISGSWTPPPVTLNT
jgi:DNA sulfur modification protein DndE